MTSGALKQLTVLGFCLGVASSAGAEAMSDVASATTFDYCTKTPPAAPEGDKLLSMLRTTGIDVASSSDSEKACTRTFKKGNALFEKSLKRNLKAVGRRSGFVASDNPEILAVQTGINRRWQEDQAARRSYIEFQQAEEPGAIQWARARSTAHATLVDADALAFMTNVLADYDWIDKHRFGARISGNAWLLVQHADKEPALQKLALQRMEAYLEDGGVRKRDYAYLWDRVAVNHGELQRYGTQPVWECQDGRLELQPLEDPDNVNQRREAMGLGTVESGLAQMSAEVCQQ